MSDGTTEVCEQVAERDELGEMLAAIRERIEKAEYRAKKAADLVTAQDSLLASSRA